MHGLGFLRTAVDVGANTDLRDTLYVSMLVVRCAADTVTDESGSSQQINATREAVGRLSAGETKQRLSDIMDLVAALPGEQARLGLAREMFAFGLDLHSAGEYDCALDVFGVVATYLRDDKSTVVAAYQRIAFIHRIAKRWAESEVAYDLMHGHAKLIRDSSMQLEATLGRAKIQIEQGDFAAARTAVSSVLARAKRRDDSIIAVKALVDMAAIAGRTRDYPAALAYSLEALERTDRRETRDRIQMNMAAAFYAVGQDQASAHLCDILLASAFDGEIRQTAAILRANIAIDSADQVTAFRLFRWLDTSVGTMAPTPAAELILTRSRWSAAIGDFAEARKIVAELQHFIIEAGVRDLASRADRALEKIAGGESPSFLECDPPKLTTAATRKVTAVAKSVLRIAS